MTSPRRELGDNPSQEQQLAVVVTHVGYILDDLRSIKVTQEKNTELIDALRVLQREQNGNVSRIKDWQTEHNFWHGPHDAGVAKHLSDLEQTDHDNEVRRGVWIGQWRVMIASAGAGAALVGASIAVMKVLGFLGG